jgi:DnaJ like chaperone protein
LKSNKPQFSQFEYLLLKNSNHLGTSILLLLAWIAASDGHIDENEARELKAIAESTNHDDEIEAIIYIAEKADLQSLQLATEIIKMNFLDDEAKLFIQMAIGIAIVDGYLRVTENYILRFIADLVSISSNSLNQIFVEMTGRSFPIPDDLSSATYWDSKKSYQKKREQEETQSDNRSSDRKRINALAILGLDEYASIQEIKNSFRRLAKIHHPDRYVSLGEEAVQAATHTFKRILSAYKYLIKNA